MANVFTKTTTANFSSTVQFLIQKQLQELLRAGLPHLLPDNYIHATHVAGSNATLRFLNVPDLTVDDAEISASRVVTEGLPNDYAPLSFGAEEFQTVQRMKTLAFTDVALLESPLALLAEGADRLARYVAALGDRIAANTIGAGANVVYVNDRPGRAGLRANDVLTGADVKKAVVKLEAAAVPRFPDGYYRGIIHPNVQYDFMMDSSVGGWIDANRYAGSEALLAGEIGRFAGVRFVSSPNAFVAPGVLGDVIPGAGNAISAATDTFTCTATNPHGLRTGNAVRVVSVSGGAPLAANTTYYAIVTSPTTFKFATSLANAKAGTAIDITTDSTAQVVQYFNDVYSTTIAGPRFFAIGDWANNETFVTPPGGHDDPGHQSALMTWKGWIGAMLIGEGANRVGQVSGPRYIRIESTSGLV